MEETTVFVHKDAFNDGIQEVKGRIDSNKVFKPSIGQKYQYQYFTPSQYSTSLKDAQKVAEYKRLKRLKSLKEQITKLEKLSF